ncbi:MAG TPA: transketolase [Bacteroidales bacterium]|nr:transketolase [Bacteroidales bacterium]HSA42655.1 transketolase [Bacteroidales bacterium]
MTQRIFNSAVLKEKAMQIRRDILRSLVAAGSGHTGGSLGMADVFTMLYFHVMNHRPEMPDWPDRDRLILSAGHIAPVLYTTLAHAGYFPLDELLTLRKAGSRLQGHPSRGSGLPGLEVSSGSLGQGLSVATGLALAARIDGKTWRVYCILGDGELQEGSVWEAAMSAAHHRLGRLIAIIDRNRLQIDGNTEHVMRLEPLAEKWQAFGWKVYTVNGHDFSAMNQVFSQLDDCGDVPVVIIANTLMGKGVGMIENDYRWHGKAPGAGELPHFLESLEKSYAQVNQSTHENE